MQLTTVASTEPKLSKILKKTIKKALSTQGIAPSTRSGNKELDLLTRKIAKQSPTIEQVTAIAEKIAAMIVHLSKQQGKTALDRGIIRQIAFNKDFTSLLVVPLTEVVPPAMATTQIEALAVTPNPVVEEPEAVTPNPVEEEAEIEEPAAEFTEEAEEEAEIEEPAAEFTEEPEEEAEIEEPAAEFTEEAEEEAEIEEPAAEFTEEAEEEAEIEEPTAEFTEEAEEEAEIEEPAAELTEEPEEASEIEEPAAELTEEPEIEEEAKIEEPAAELMEIEEMIPTSPENKPLPIVTKSKPLTRAN